MENGQNNRKQEITFVDHPDANLLMPRDHLVRAIAFRLGGVVQWTEMGQVIPGVGRWQLALAVGHLLETKVSGRGWWDERGVGSDGALFGQCGLVDGGSPVGKGVGLCLVVVIRG